VNRDCQHHTREEERLPRTRLGVRAFRAMLARPFVDEDDRIHDEWQKPGVEEYVVIE
jgi:hypothetical protein